MTANSTSSDIDPERVTNRQPLYLIVGDRKVSPCDHGMEPAFHPFFDTMLKMAHLSIEKNIALEIR